MSGKYKYLLKNLGLMTISNFTSKILSFLLVPLYTNVLSTAEYGTYDLYVTTAFLFIPLLSVCISEAVLRYALDKKTNPSSVISIGFKFCFRACICMLCLVLLNYNLGIVNVFNQYPGFFLIYYALCLLADILTQFANGLEKVFDVAVAGILSSVITVVMNILLLLIFPIGLKGYFIASCMAFGITIVYLAIRLKIWRLISFDINHELREEMVQYSSPYIFNQLAWWINNVSDRYIVTWFCGTASNGVYSAAYKVPSVLTMFQTIFNQAWTLSAVKESDNNASDFYSDIYRVYNCGMVVTCSILIMMSKMIARILFAKEFYDAWKYAPFLLISVVFGSLSGVFSGVFTATKDSRIVAKTTITGASVNTVLNIILVYICGPVGAAVATMISYILVWASRLREVNKIVKFSIRIERDLFSYLLLIVQALLLLIQTDGFLILCGEMLLVVIITWMYRKEIGPILIKVFSKLRKDKYCEKVD